MKRLTIILATTFVCASCGVTLYPDRGVAVTASVNISVQPPWGPAGYDYAPYYYFPDFNIYYDVDRALFRYYSRGRWIAVRQLPAGYPRDLYKFYKVVIDTDDPWLYNRRHKNKYRKYRGIHTQPVRRDAPDRRDPRPTPYRHNDPTQRRDDRPSRNDIRDSRNNDTGKGYRPAGRDSAPNRNGHANGGGEQRKGSAAKRSIRNDDRAKSADRNGTKSSGSRSAGSRGR